MSSRHLLPLVLLVSLHSAARAQPAPGDDLGALRAADRADRAGAPPADLGLRDAARRLSVRRLLDADAVHGGDQLDAAALVYSRGGASDDQLVARELGILAAAAGAPGPLPARAEDSWLLSIGDPQRFGTAWRGGRLLPVDARGDTAVNDALRAQLALPALAALREREDAPAPAPAPPAAAAPADVADRRAPLAARAAQGASTSADRHDVLALYRDGRLADARSCLAAARVLATSHFQSERLLASELAMAAAMRGEAGAGRVFAETWDRFCMSRNRPPRYGTVRGGPGIAPTVPPIVRQSFDLSAPGLAGAAPGGSPSAAAD